MSKTNNMGIADSEFYEAVREISRYGVVLQDRMKHLCDALDQVRAEGIRDTRIDAELESLASQIRALDKPLHEAVDAIVKDGKNFPKKIDSADKFLY